jgi:hypothetical protein
MKTGIRRQSYAVLALGISICLFGAFLMVAGEAIVGPDHTGIAMVVGIVGIGGIPAPQMQRYRSLQ